MDELDVHQQSQFLSMVVSRKNDHVLGSSILRVIHAYIHKYHKQNTIK